MPRDTVSPSWGQWCARVAMGMSGPIGEPFRTNLSLGHLQHAEEGGASLSVTAVKRAARSGRELFLEGASHLRSSVCRLSCLTGLPSLLSFRAPCCVPWAPPLLSCLSVNPSSPRLPSAWPFHFTWLKGTCILRTSWSPQLLSCLLCPLLS